LRKGKRKLHKKEAEQGKKDNISDGGGEIVLGN
jgi:hypothetical protein